MAQYQNMIVNALPFSKPKRDKLLRCRGFDRFWDLRMGKQIAVVLQFHEGEEGVSFVGPAEKRGPGAGKAR